MPNDLPIEFRDAELSDLPFIRSTWMRTQQLQPYTITRDLSRLVELMLPQCTVAYANKDPDHVVGYICSHKFPLCVIHWVYVKHAFRKLGVAKSLFNHRHPNAIMSQIEVTATNSLGDLLKDKYRMYYNPYFLWGRKI